MNVSSKQKVGNIVVITKNTYYFTLHRVCNIDLHNAENSISGPLDFKIFWGGMPPDPPRGPRLRRSYLITPLNKYCCQYERPSKILSYGPEITGFYNTNLRHLTLFLCRVLWSPWKQTSIIFDKRGKLYLRKSAYAKTCCSFWCFSYIELSVSLTSYSNGILPTFSQTYKRNPWGPFLEGPKAFRTRKAVAKSHNA